MLWECVDEALEEVETNVLQGGVTHFSTYSVVYRPHHIPDTSIIIPVFNFFEEYLVEFIIGCVLLVVFVLISTYTMSRLNRYRDKWKKVKRHLATTGAGGAEMVVYDENQVP